jgi:hypothetical protein
MHVPSGCHIFQIYHKNRTACMRMVGDAPKCIFLVEGRHAIAYIFYDTLYAYLCQHHEVFYNFHIGSVFMLVTAGFYAQN